MKFDKIVEDIGNAWQDAIPNGILNKDNPYHVVILEEVLDKFDLTEEQKSRMLSSVRGEKQVISEKKGDTGATTFYHEVITGIFVAGGKGPFNTGEDVKKYFDNNTIKAVNSGLATLDVMKLPQSRFLTADSIPKKSIISDAKKIASKIKSELGRGKNVMWTGPTNDASKFGAGDIAGTFSGYGDVGVSLKAGKGQLKNLTVNTFFKALGLPKVNSQYFLTTYKKHWDTMTSDWVSLVEKKLESKLKGDGKDEARSIFSKHAKKTWDDYQKENITKEELDILNTALGTKIKYTKFRDFCRKLYDDYGSEWNTLRDKHFDGIFNEFSDKYDSKIRNGLHNLFKRQLSVGDTSIFYAAKGGKVFWFIPSEKLYDNNLPPEAFISNYETKGSGSGYEFLLDVGVQTPKTGIPIGTIKVIFRWKQGQMSGFPDTTSDYNLMAKDWSGLLGGFRK
jgi:hypothetical protein